MRDFMLKHADEIWKNEDIMVLFNKVAVQQGVNLKSVESFKSFIKNNRKEWFDVIFKQEL